MEDPFALCVGMQTGATTVEIRMEIDQKINNGSSFGLSDPTTGCIYNRNQNTNSKEHKYPYVHCTVLYNHQDMEAAQVSIKR